MKKNEKNLPSYSSRMNEDEDEDKVDFNEIKVSFTPVAGCSMSLFRNRREFQRVLTKPPSAVIAYSKYLLSDATCTKLLQKLQLTECVMHAPSLYFLQF